jgi:hypothetical protein
MFLRPPNVFATRRRPLVSGVRVLLWVKLRKARYEQILSGMPPIADVSEPCRHFRVVPILLQKSLMASANSDSVAVTVRFAAEAGNDGAAQSRPRAAILLILS